MNLQQLRDAVRNQLDLDDNDLPNATLDLYIQDGYNEAIDYEVRWPFFEIEWEVTALANASGVTIPVEAREITAVKGPYGPVNRLDQQEAEIYFGTAPPYACPQYWSRVGRTMNLWPRPDADFEITLRGFRAPADWIAGGAGAEVDADSRLHLPIIYYACSLAYEQQEDEVLSVLYMNRYRMRIERAHASIMEPWESSPRILGGNALLPKRGYPIAYAVPGPAEEEDGGVDGGSP